MSMPETVRRAINPGHEHRDFWRCFFEVVQNCWSALEVGAAEGNNLRALGPGVKKVAVEIHEPYVRPGDGIVWHIGDCRDILPRLPDKRFDLVMLIDIIEHLEKPDAVKLLDEADRLAAKRIVVFTPKGHMIQNDEWHDDYRPWSPGLIHRCGFEPEELEARGYDVCVWENYHNDYIAGTQTVPAMFAVKDTSQ